MSVTMSEADNTVVVLTAEIVAAYVGRNSVVSADLPKLIAVVHGAMSALGAQAAPEVEKPKPPVSIKRSVTPEHLISLEDGKPYKSLKRHLAGRGMTPAAYREKWGLPDDYPMVAAAYSAQRSALALKLGLGRKSASPAPVAAKRGRKPKAA